MPMGVQVASGNTEILHSNGGAISEVWITRTTRYHEEMIINSTSTFLTCTTRQLVMELSIKRRVSLNNKTLMCDFVEWKLQPIWPTSINTKRNLHISLWPQCFSESCGLIHSHSGMDALCRLFPMRRDWKAELKKPSPGPLVRKRGREQSRGSK